mgnify:FL=1
MTTGKETPWRWVPSIYFGTGTAQAAIATLALLLYKQLGLSNAEITLYTGLLFLPWLLRPLWSPFLGLIRTPRWWIVSMQLMLGVALGGVAFTIPTAHWLQGTFAFLVLLAFALAVHETEADVFYHDTVKGSTRSGLSSMPNTFRLLAFIFVQGFLVMVAGNLQLLYRNSISLSWSLIFYSVAGLFILSWLWHRTALPSPYNESIHLLRRQQRCEQFAERWQEVKKDILSFFAQHPRQQLAAVFCFTFCFLLPETLTSKVAMLFLVDSNHNGGLGLSPQEFGLTCGTVGVVGLIAGSLLGKAIIAAKGLRTIVLPLSVAILLPNALYVLLSETQPTSLGIINLCIFIGQTSLGLALVTYWTTLKSISKALGNHTVYIFLTSVLALAQMVPSMFSGALQEWLGYNNLFLIALACGVLSLVGCVWVRPMLKNKGNDYAENNKNIDFS